MLHKAGIIIMLAITASYIISYNQFLGLLAKYNIGCGLELVLDFAGSLRPTILVIVHAQRNSQAAQAMA